MNLVYRVTPRKRLVFTEHAVKQMRAFAQHGRFDTEAGGVLLGRHLLESRDVVVDEVTTPQGADRRGRVSFFRSKAHEKLVRARWMVSGNTTAYLGLWHTHPEDDPTPSSVDRRDWEQAVSVDTYEGDRLYFPIIGTEKMRVWTLSRRGTFKELQEERRNG